MVTLCPHSVSAGDQLAPPPFIQARILAYKMVPPTFRVGLPSSGNILTSQKHQSCVPMVTVSPVQLTVKINHYGYLISCFSYMSSSLWTF